MFLPSNFKNIILLFFFFFFKSDSPELPAAKKSKTQEEDQVQGKRIVKVLLKFSSLAEVNRYLLSVPICFMSNHVSPSSNDIICVYLTLLLSL